MRAVSNSTAISIEHRIPFPPSAAALHCVALSGESQNASCGCGRQGQRPEVCQSFRTIAAALADACVAADTDTDTKADTDTEADKSVSQFR